MKNIPDHWRITLLIAIVVLGFAFRFYQLEVLPGWNSDEGRWALGPATGAMYGDWSKGGTRFSFVSPTWTRLLYLDFLLVGPSILHARWASALLGLLCVPLIYVICVRAGLGHRVGLLAALFFATDTCASMMSRPALADSVVTAGIVAGLALFLGGPRQRLLSVVVIAAAICAKPTAVAALGVVYIHQLGERSPGQRPDLGRYVRAAILPLLAVALSCACFLLVYLRHPSEFVRAWQSELTLRRSASAVFYNPFLEHGLLDAVKYFVLRMPLLLATGAAGAIMMLRQRPRPSLMPVWWLALSVGSVAVQNHQPARYYLPAIPALCICAAYVVARLLGSESSGGRSIAWLRRAGTALVACIVLYSATGWCVYYLILKGHREVFGPEAVRWMDSNLPRDAKVFGVSMWGVGRRCDYYPLEVCVPDYRYPDSFIRKTGIRYVVYDDREWGGLAKKLRIDPKADLAKHCKLVKQIGDIGVWRCGR